MRKYVFFNHVGQLVRRVLVGFGQAVKFFGQLTHDEANSGNQYSHNGGELPIEVEQLADQSKHGDGITDQRHDGVDQQARAVVHFINDSVGQFAGVLLCKQA